MASEVVFECVNDGSMLGGVLVGWWLNARGLSKLHLNVELRWIEGSNR